MIYDGIYYIQGNHDSLDLGNVSPLGVLISISSTGIVTALGIVIALGIPTGLPLELLEAEGSRKGVRMRN